MMRQVIFWLTFGLIVLITLFYLLMLFISGDTVFKTTSAPYFLGVLINVLAIIAQIKVLTHSMHLFKAEPPTPAVNLYATLLGFSLLIAFIWAGGCSLSLSSSSIRIAG